MSDTKMTHEEQRQLIIDLHTKHCGDVIAYDFTMDDKDSTVHVSTIHVGFAGVDYQTRIMGGVLDGCIREYESKKDAVIGHRGMVLRAGFSNAIAQDEVDGTWVITVPCVETTYTTMIDSLAVGGSHHRDVDYRELEDANSGHRQIVAQLRVAKKSDSQSHGK